MAVKKSADGDLSNEVQIIREILFGEQIGNLSQQLADLEQKVQALQKENQRLDKALKAEAAARQSGMSEDIEKITKANRQAQNKVRSLERKLGRELTAHKEGMQAELQAAIRKMGDQLKQVQAATGDHQTRLDDLVGSLADALRAHQSATNPEESQ